MLFKSTMATIMLATCLQAQANLDHPPFYGPKEGAQASTVPFGTRDVIATNRQCIYQQVHGALATKPVTIKSLTFRRDGAYRFDWEAYSVEMELRLSTAATTPTTISSTLANNRGANPTLVVAKKKIHFPISKNTSGLPEPFAFKIPFDTGKSFILGAGKGLCWEARVFDNDLYTVSKQHREFDCVSPSSIGVYAYYGDGCFAPAMFRSYWGFMNFNYHTVAGFRLYGDCFEGPMNGWTFTLVSLGRLTTGIPFGAPFCHLWINPNAFIVSGPYKLDFQGKGIVGPTTPILTMPNDPKHYGFDLFGQWVAVDSKASAIYLSNGVKVQKGHVWKPGTGPEVSRVFKAGSVIATSGKVEKFTGLITRFGF